MDMHLKQHWPVQIAQWDAGHLIAPAEKMFEAAEYMPGEYSTWHSPQRTPNIPESDRFRAVLEVACDQLAGQQGIDLKRYRCIIPPQAMWLNNMGPGDQHETHVHGGCHYSGTFYLSTPPGCSPIRFHNPMRLLWKYVEYPIERWDTSPAGRCVDYQPHPGLLLIWNSWLEHEVTPTAQGGRRGISFNLQLAPRS